MTMAKVVTITEMSIYAIIMTEVSMQAMIVTKVSMNVYLLSSSCRAGIVKL